MKTIYLGHNPHYAVICARETELMAVFWHDSDGNMALRTQTMLDYCRINKIVSIHHSALNNLVMEIIKALKPDLIVVGEYYFLLKQNLIDIPRLGTINMHGAPLPRYRGAHPINWMIINGETEGAVTCHYVTEGLDQGDIIDQYTFPIDIIDTAYDVRPKLETTGGKLLTDVLRRFKKEGRLPAFVQDESQALYTPPRTPEDGVIDWNTTPMEIYNFVRALTRPYHGAYTYINGKKCIIWAVGLPKEKSSAEFQSEIDPGKILEILPDSFLVSVSNGTVTVLDWETKAPISVNDLFTGV